MHPRRSDAKGRGSISAALALCCLLTSGCGTTVQLGSPDSFIENSDAGLGPGAPGPEGSHSPTERRGSLPSGAHSPGGSTESGGSTGWDPSTTTRAQRVRGVTASSISLGVVYISGTDSTIASAGAKGAFGDPKVYLAAGIDDLNKRGGLFGRTIIPHYRAFDANRTDSAAQVESLCAAFTTDVEVFALIGSIRQTDSFRDCLERRRLPFMSWGSSTNADQTTYSRFPHYVESGTLAMDRAYRTLAEHLIQRRFLMPQNKIGILRYAGGSFERVVRDQLKPALRTHKVPVAAEFTVARPQTTNELGATAAAIQSAVLRFRNSGVDRVIFVEDGTSLSYLFAESAESQLYRPHYALSTQNAPNWLASNLPPAQLMGAAGVGWYPVVDITEADDAVNASQVACLQIMRHHGVDVDTRDKKSQAYAVCDNLTVFTDAVRAAGPTLTANSFISGYESLRSQPRLALTHSVSFTPDRHDGVHAVRDLVYAEPCRCFRYVGGWAPIV